MFSANATQITTNDKLYVDDVFSTYLYTGNGSTQTINNGIDLVGEGGLVWMKQRNGAGWHWLFDTVRGVNKGLYTNSTSQQADVSGQPGLNKFNANGFQLGSHSEMNGSGAPVASWTFRRAPKFFDVVTYTGNGVAGRQIPHSLGVAPGMIVVKRIDSSGIWAVYHRGTGAAKVLQLEDIGAAYSNSAYWNNTEPSDAGFTVGNNAYVNTNGGQYVAYLFAHDDSEDGIIRCGSFTTDANGNATVDLGWEPQYVLLKNRAVGSGASTSNWFVLDVLRGMSVSDFSDSSLYPNLNDAEQGAMNVVNPTATGFTVLSNPSSTGIYLAIRRPNKPPKTGAEVYNSIARTGTGGSVAINAGFAADAVITKGRALSVRRNFWQDKLRGFTAQLASDGTEGELSFNSSTNILGWLNTGLTFGNSAAVNASGETYINHFFRRAPGFFDVACYTTGQYASNTVPHNLGVVPELCVRKERNAGGEPWQVGGSVVPTPPAQGAHSLRLNTPDASGQYGGTPLVTQNTFLYGSNSTATQYVVYLFASLPGISKVGSYTGNGTSQTIDCGFTTGARFILVKRTDAAGDWYVWDTARGIVAANDPHLSLNSNAAEVTTDDSVDPHASGFIVNQVAATNINVSGGQYIFLSVA